MEIKNMVSEIKSKLDSRGGLKAIYFAACGGSQAAIYPAKYLIQCEAKNIATGIFNSSEFVNATPAMIDDRCICVICSLKATPETVEAVKAANEKGAITVAMTGFADSEMAKNGQYSIIYSNGQNQVYSKANQALALKFCFEALKQFEDFPYYDEAMQAYDYIDNIIEKGKKDILPLAQKFAKDFKDDSVFYVLASGPAYPAAYSMACCHLMEMQQKHAVYLHSGEYFHGPFETTDETVPVILIKSVGKTRPLDDRVERFLKKYAPRHMILDMQEFDIGKIDEHVVEYFASPILTPMERFMVSTMADLRGRSMDERRYMWKVEY
ncbi:SIS domain-containing protein [Tepidanaerobacter syntrophicus]|uniref:SIS domain-containing protein n=1 Tax=Tepidanaerobacter syntrophicus TaxID=224999 RepID=UPI001BD4A759|nr:SIS domain-containing protein [Tepidanaerobacter syntrophicus]